MLLIVHVVLCSPLSQNKNPEMGVESIMSLLSAVDEWIPEPVRVFDKPFLMPVENTHSIPGRGTVVTGQIERGMIKKGEEVEFVGYKSKIKTTVTGEDFVNCVLCMHSWNNCLFSSMLM